MTEHPRSSEISAAIAQRMPHAGAWSGTFFRATVTSYANSVDLLSGKGSGVGGRWNPPGYRSVYGSLDPHIAMAESLANYEDYGIPLSQAMPLVFVGVNARLQAVLDVMSAEFLDPLGLTVAGLSQIDWQAEQDAGREALRKRLAGRPTPQDWRRFWCLRPASLPAAISWCFRSGGVREAPFEWRTLAACRRKERASRALPDWEP